LTYALDGQLARDYPAFVGKPIRFELRTEHPTTQREEQFLDIVVRKHLEPERITFLWKMLGKSAPQTPPKPKWKLVDMTHAPNKSPEPTAVTAAVVIHAANRRWFSFCR
jgi:hypothetical protein